MGVHHQWFCNKTWYSTLLQNSEFLFVSVYSAVIAIIDFCSISKAWSDTSNAVPRRGRAGANLFKYSRITWKDRKRSSRHVRSWFHFVWPCVESAKGREQVPSLPDGGELWSMGRKGYGGERRGQSSNTAAVKRELGLQCRVVTHQHGAQWR